MRGLLFDLDGVVYNDESLIPGAVETIGWAASRRVPYLFVTNTTSRNRLALVEKLGRFGIATDAAHILTPCVAAANWLRSQDGGPVALFVRDAAREEFEGLPQVPPDAETGAAYVVIGDLGEAWDYKTLNRAFRLLHHQPDAKLVALGMTRYWQTAEGLSLDVAPFVVALEHASGRQAVVFGKPAAAFFHAAARQLGLDSNEIVMIGDDIHADIGGAQAAGLKGVLVKTGKFRPSALVTSVKPDAILDSIAAVPEWWDSFENTGVKTAKEA
ncbi:MAG: TIGR01458 family HAD-type hydrolase [Acidobacteriia bacterium]|nr:TIGR01458 family HAD-type hydrolase [Terriglobia bacterium]